MHYDLERNERSGEPEIIDGYELPREGPLFAILDIEVSSKRKQG